jgi:hypothetical protein|tara:strand:- start:1640 stop:1870 length:231 start_codon:yes stop_codon:yes gene_type:complete
MPQRKPAPKRKKQKDFVKSQVGRAGKIEKVYDTVAFNNYQAKRISRLMNTGPTGMPYYKSTGTMVPPDKPKFKMGN